MQQIQMIFDRVKANKKKARDIRFAHRDALNASGEYKEIQEKMKTLRARRKQIEMVVNKDFESELAKLQDLKIDIESDEAILADAVMSQYVKGEIVEVVDEWENKYVPQWKVKFRKN